MRIRLISSTRSKLAIFGLLFLSNFDDISRIIGGNSFGILYKAYLALEVI